MFHDHAIAILKFEFCDLVTVVSMARTPGNEVRYRNQDGVHEQGVEGVTSNKLSGVIQGIRI